MIVTTYKTSKISVGNKLNTILDQYLPVLQEKDVVVIGGSMMNKIGIPVDRVRAHLKGILHIFPELPVITHSALADVGGLHGALHFIKQNLGK